MILRRPQSQKLKRKLPTKQGVVGPYFCLFGMGVAKGTGQDTVTDSLPGTSGRLYLVGQRGGSKITADGDCSHEIKRCLLLGRKVMTNLDSI